MNDMTAVIDFTQLERLKADLEEDFAEVYEVIFHSISEILDELSNHPHEPETLTRLFHSLKSPARSLGATRLANQAEQFEKQADKREVKNVDGALEQLHRLYAEVKHELKDYAP